MIDTFSDLHRYIDQFLHGQIAGKAIVWAIDEFVSTDKVYDLPEALANDVLELQNQTAMYVADAERRIEYSAYIDDNELRQVLISFLDKITR